ncbi:hypothetical protein ACQEUX_22045 [Micromonospora sp. CA-259024]|uniref:hypothetical protein n=1 Tax=Micromonospora sp. CA-259024 TaxID=3239965 RepID=UPI003D9488D7
MDEPLAEASAFGDSFSFSLGARGLAQMQADLREPARSVLELRLEGNPVTRHEVRVDALSRLLSSLQESVSSIAQAIVGKITTRAAIPGPLREATALRLAATFPGSFGAVLKGPEQHGTQREIPGIGDSVDILDESVTRVLDVIGLVNNGGLDEEPIVDAVLPLGARAFKHLSDLSRVVADTGMSAAISWQKPGADARDAVFSKPIAQRLGDVLDRNHLTEEQAVIEGRLGTVSDIRNRIELQMDDGKVITASVIDELVPELGQFFTQRVQGTFEVTTARSIVTGTERRSYRLVVLAHAIGVPTSE